MNSDVSPASFAFTSKPGGYFINFFVVSETQVTMTFGTHPSCAIPNLAELVREEFENIELNPSDVVGNMVSIALPIRLGEKRCQQVIENFLDYLEDEHLLHVEDARQQLPNYITTLFEPLKHDRKWYFQKENKRLTDAFATDPRLAQYDTKAIGELAFRLGGNDTLQGVQELLYDAGKDGVRYPGLGNNPAIQAYLEALKQHERARDLLDIIRNPNLPFITENKRQCRIMHEAMLDDPSLRSLEEDIRIFCTDSMNGNKNLEELLERVSSLRTFGTGYVTLLESCHFTEYREAMIRFTEKREKSGGATP